MDIPAPQPEPGVRFTVERYLALVDEGVLAPDDHVELLEGVVVAMAPQNSPHASAVARVTTVLIEAIGRRAVVRSQLSLIAGRYSMPEPDVAVVPGRFEDYDHAHPSSALLVVEVSDSSLKMDRLTKAMVYAAAGVPEYWIANVRAGQVEVHRAPEPAARRYAEITIIGRDGRIAPVAFPDLIVAADDLLPRPTA